MDFPLLPKASESVIATYLRSVHLRALGLFCFLIVAPFAALADSDVEEKGTILFPASNEPLVAVEQVLKEAEEKGTHALIVLGANWCHDSRALARRLNKTPLAELVHEHYATQLIDVGYYEFGFEVMRAFGEPIYYATPTVLVVDPTTRSLVNFDNRHQWGNAYNITMQESVDYFSQMSSAAAPDPADLRISRQHAVEIDAWENAAALRVAAAYEAFGPMIQAFDSGKVPTDFRERFSEFARFRMSIPDGLSSLRQQAREAYDAGMGDARLEFPELPSLHEVEASP